MEKLRTQWNERERRLHPTVSLRVIGVLNCDRAKALILIDVTFTCGDLKGSDHSHIVCVCETVRENLQKCAKN